VKTNNIQAMIETIEATSSIRVKRLDRNNYKDTDLNNYRLLWLEKGVDSLKLDHEIHPNIPFSIVFVHPGKKIRLRFACDQKPVGWILQFPVSFFRDQHLISLNIIHHADVFISQGEILRIALSPKIGKRINVIAEMIAEMLQSNIPNRELAASALLKTLFVYCESSCNIKLNKKNSTHHISLVSKFKHLVAHHLTTQHQVCDYARALHITPHYLNQVVKTVMGVTAKQVIQEQLLMQACRDLKFSSDSVKEISIRLGFSEPEHFSNFFKKAIGSSPLLYRQK
jgi:AraC family transcriptional regulator, transcriptional activator of pobA